MNGHFQTLILMGCKFASITICFFPIWLKALSFIKYKNINIDWLTCNFFANFQIIQTMLVTFSKQIHNLFNVRCCSAAFTQAYFRSWKNSCFFLFQISHSNPFLIYFLLIYFFIIRNTKAMTYKKAGKRIITWNIVRRNKTTTELESNELQKEKYS